jgi:hypothetical protein
VPPHNTRRWRSGWPDLIAFVLGLSVAWLSGWNTTDLVWSLWLSSLVVGYSMIVWSIVQPALELSELGWRHRAEVQQSVAPASRTTLMAMAAAVLVGGLFILAFFTFHFGGFHYIHSQFLISFFPIDGASRTATLSTYREVLDRYWLALPSAFLAERSAFLRRTFAGLSAPLEMEVTPEAIARRKAANARKPVGRMTAPYLKVMRMHVLIILFGALHAAKLEGFAVYALVYALYFFPWRLLRGQAKGDGTATLSATPLLSQ